MKDIETLLPRVLRHAPTCPEILAVSHLRDAAKEFCRRTKLWREADSFTIGATGEDVMCAPAGSFIVEIAAARIDGGVWLEPATTIFLDRDVPGWRDAEAGVARYITQSEPDSVRVTPPQAGKLWIELVLAPSDSADQLPNFMVDQYAEVLEWGATGGVLLTPGDFRDDRLAVAMAGMFTSRLAALAISARRGQQNAPIRTRARFV